MKLNKAREQLIKMYTDALKEDTLPWKKGWNETYSVHHFNPVSDTKYKGVNNALLSIVSAVRGYKDPRWMTFNQIKEKGFTLENAKGQGIPVEFWSVYDTANKTTVSIAEYNATITNDPDRKKDFKMIDRIYHVFNATHIKGISDFVLEEQPKKVMNASPFIDNLIKNMNVQYTEKGNRAFYSPTTDEVVVPQSHQFHGQYEYEATRLHELCHATGHASRLNRAVDNWFGTADYAKEELRAEIASSFLAQEMDLDVSQINLDNHKAYIQNWIQTLENDPNELFRAIKDAENISTYISETGELEKFRLREAGEIIEEPEVISLEKFLAQKGLALPVSDYMLDKSKIPHGLTNRQWSLFEKDSYAEINDYHENRKAAIKEYEHLVSQGKIRSQTEIEKRMEIANGHSDNEFTLAARRMLAKQGIDWYTGETITSDLNKPRYFIDMDGCLVHFNNTIPSLDILHEKGYYRHLLPQDKVVELTKELLAQAPNQVYILSAKLDSPYAAKEKIEWVKEYIPEMPESNIILTPYGKPKYEYVPGGMHTQDVLLDDYTDNLIQWREHGGKSVKIINNINASQQRWQASAISYLDEPSTALSVIQKEINDPHIHLYYGSVNQLEDFSSEKVEGYGFHLTPSMELAKQNAQTGYLYDVSFTANQPIEVDKLTLDHDQLNDILSHFDEQTFNQLISTYGVIHTEGVESLKEVCITNVLEQSHSDMEVIEMLITQSNAKEKTLDACSEAGYTHTLTEDNGKTMYHVLSAKNLQIDATYQINEDDSISLLKSEEKVINVDIQYHDNDIQSIENDLLNLNHVLKENINDPSTTIRVNMNIDDRPFLRNEKITIYDLKNSKALDDMSQKTNIFLLLKEKAKNNLLTHQNNNHDIEKYARLEELLEKMEFIQIEEFVGIGI